MSALHSSGSPFRRAIAISLSYMQMFTDLRVAGNCLIRLESFRTGSLSLRVAL